MEKIQRANCPDKSSGKMKITFGGAEKPQTGKNSFSVNKVNHSHRKSNFLLSKNTQKSATAPNLSICVTKLGKIYSCHYLNLLYIDYC